MAIFDPRQFLVPMLIGCFLLASSAHAQTAIWGRNGENWEPTSILPDFSHAGYQHGEQPIPDRTVDVLVTKYGATTTADATTAFQTAIDENPGRCIGIPQGRFTLSDRLRITTTGTVLKGVSPRETTLHFTRSLEQIEPRPTENGGGTKTTQWSWGGGLIVVGSDETNWGPGLTITGTHQRGDFTVTVAKADGLAVGDSVQLTLTDDQAGSLGQYLYRETPGENSLIKGKIRFEQVARIVAIDGNDITLDRPLRTDIESAWTPKLFQFMPQVENCGLEQLTIDFPATPYRGHFTEVGYNAVEVRGTNNWVRNIEIHNCDSGIYVYGQFNTVDGVTIRADREPEKTGNTGHHGLSAFGQDCLITNFLLRTKFFHDLGVSNGSVGNVFSDGAGVDLCIDHHRFAPYENLFTNINLGRGERVWKSGGTQGKGRHTAAGATFWNLDSRYKIGPPKEDYGPRDLIFVGLNTRDSGSSQPVILPNGWYYESRRPGRFTPKNLHQAQLQRRLKRAQ